MLPKSMIIRRRRRSNILKFILRPISRGSQKVSQQTTDLEDQKYSYMHAAETSKETPDLAETKMKIFIKKRYRKSGKAVYKLIEPEGRKYFMANSFFNFTQTSLRV